MKLNENSIYKMMFASYPDIVRVEDVARMLDMSYPNVTTNIKEGKIKSFKIGNQYRIPKLAVVEFVLTSSSYTDLDFNKWISKEVCDMLGVSEEELSFELTREDVA